MTLHSYIYAAVESTVIKVVGVEGNAPSLPPCKSGTLLLS